MQFNTTDNARQSSGKASAWLNMAVGCFDKICTCSSSYSQDQVENEILNDECTIRNEAYWRTVEEALSAQDSVDDTDANDQSASVEPSGLRQLIGAVRKIEVAMGDGVKRVIKEEVPIAKNLRQHLDWKGLIVDK